MGLGLLAAAVVVGAPPSVVLPLAAVPVILTVPWRTLLSWRSLTALLLIVVVFVPIRRYSLPGNLPFELEPYRVVVAALVLIWLGSLLVDPAVRLRHTGMRAPLFLLVAVILASIAANADRIGEFGVGADVAKSVTFFASFLLLILLVSSLLTTREELDAFLRTLVVCMAVLAFFALFEGATGRNYFNQLDRYLPFLNFDGLPFSLREGRGGRERAYASAEHPIALGAAFVLVAPIAVYLARRTGRRLWLGAAALMLVGTLSTVSRTGIVMIVVLGLVYLRLWPRSVKRILPALLPLVVVVQLALPGTFGALRSVFFPEGGIIASEAEGGSTRGSGRLADVGPSLEEWLHRPLVGQGFGTRITDKERQNARILDDQWLASLLEIGFLGVLALLWLVGRQSRRLLRRAREDDGPHGWLCGGLAAGIIAFSIGMFTYDAFSFIQVTILFFLLLGVSAVALRLPPVGDDDLPRSAA
ncbi:MAG: O-antigen ligase family protein [Thermoleophilia bacterium]